MAYQKHMTFAVFSEQAITDFAPRLTAYKVFKNCFQVPVDWQIDKALVIDMARARLAELDASS